MRSSGHFVGRSINWIYWRTFLQAVSVQQIESRSLSVSSCYVFCVLVVVPIVASLFLFLVLLFVCLSFSSCCIFYVVFLSCHVFYNVFHAVFSLLPVFCSLFCLLRSFFIMLRQCFFKFCFVVLDALTDPQRNRLFYVLSSRPVWGRA